MRSRNVWENREISWRKTLEKSLLEQCDDAEEDRPVSEVASVTSCDVGTTPSDVPSNSKSKGPSRPVQWTRPQSLLVFVQKKRKTTLSAKKSVFGNGLFVKGGGGTPLFRKEISANFSQKSRPWRVWGGGGTTLTESFRDWGY